MSAANSAIVGQGVKMFSMLLRYALRIALVNTPRIAVCAMHAP
jgi:hypothetical protein